MESNKQNLKKVNKTQSIQYYFSSRTRLVPVSGPPCTNSSTLGCIHGVGNAPGNKVIKPALESEGFLKPFTDCLVPSLFNLG